MEDLHIAAKEKEKPDHDVIDEAIGEEAEVNICSTDTSTIGSCLTGIYCLLNPCWSDIPAKRCQSKESQD